MNPFSVLRSPFSVYLIDTDNGLRITERFAAGGRK
jgi:hypothetical protein